MTGELVAEIGASGVTHDEDIGQVSLVGAGMKTNPGVAATMFEILANDGVNIEMISTSSIRICVRRRRGRRRAVRAGTAHGVRSRRLTPGICGFRHPARR